MNLLCWKTASEKDFSHFEIQHSSDASLFVTIGRVSGMQLDSCSYTEKIHRTGTNYYRLKMVDKDEPFAYSGMISITNDAGGSLVSDFYPNPALGTAFADISP